MNNSGNVFGSYAKQHPADRIPVWLEVKERKIGGGTFDISNLAVGTLLQLGIPVYLPKMGGEAVILDTFVVDGSVSSSATAIKLKDGALGTKPVKGMIVGKVGSDGKAAKAAALGDFTAGTGFAITANALGTLSDGDVLMIIAEEGSNKAAVLPTGLSWRQIYKDDACETKASVSVVTKGQILVDRIPEIPALYKAALTGITFEHEL